MFGTFFQFIGPSYIGWGEEEGTKIRLTSFYNRFFIEPIEFGGYNRTGVPDLDIIGQTYSDVSEAVQEADADSAVLGMELRPVMVGIATLDQKATDALVGEPALFVDFAHHMLDFGDVGDFYDDFNSRFINWEPGGDGLKLYFSNTSLRGYPSKVLRVDLGESHADQMGPLHMDRDFDGVMSGVLMCTLIFIVAVLPSTLISTSFYHYLATHGYSNPFGAFYLSPVYGSFGGIANTLSQSVTNNRSPHIFILTELKYLKFLTLASEWRQHSFAFRGGFTNFFSLKPELVKILGHRLTQKASYLRLELTRLLIAIGNLSGSGGESGVGLKREAVFSDSVRSPMFNTFYQKHFRSENITEFKIMRGGSQHVRVTPTLVDLTTFWLHHFNMNYAAQSLCFRPSRGWISASRIVGSVLEPLYSKFWVTLADVGLVSDLFSNTLYNFYKRSQGVDGLKYPHQALTKWESLWKDTFGEGGWLGLGESGKYVKTFTGYFYPFLVNRRYNMLGSLSSMSEWVLYRRFWLNFLSIFTGVPWLSPKLSFACWVDIYLPYFWKYDRRFLIKNNPIDGRTNYNPAQLSYEHSTLLKSQFSWSNALDGNDRGATRFGGSFATGTFRRNLSKELGGMVGLPTYGIGTGAFPSLRFLEGMPLVNGVKLWSLSGSFLTDFGVEGDGFRKGNSFISFVNNKFGSVSALRVGPNGGRFAGTFATVADSDAQQANIKHGSRRAAGRARKMHLSTDKLRARGLAGVPTTAMGTLTSLKEKSLSYDKVAWHRLQHLLHRPSVLQSSSALVDSPYDQFGAKKDIFPVAYTRKRALHTKPLGRSTFFTQGNDYSASIYGNYAGGSWGPRIGFQDPYSRGSFLGLFDDFWRFSYIYGGTGSEYLRSVKHWGFWYQDFVNLASVYGCYRPLLYGNLAKFLTHYGVRSGFWPVSTDSEAVRLFKLVFYENFSKASFGLAGVPFNYWVISLYGDFEISYLRYLFYRKFFLFQYVSSAGVRSNLQSLVKLANSPASFRAPESLKYFISHPWFYATIKSKLSDCGLGILPRLGKAYNGSNREMPNALAVFGGVAHKHNIFPLGFWQQSSWSGDYFWETVSGLQLFSFFSNFDGDFYKLYVGLGKYVALPDNLETFSLLLRRFKSFESVRTNRILGFGYWWLGFFQWGSTLSPDGSLWDAELSHLRLFQLLQYQGGIGWFRVISEYGELFFWVDLSVTPFYEKLLNQYKFLNIFKLAPKDYIFNKAVNFSITNQKLTSLLGFRFPTKNLWSPLQGDKTFRGAILSLALLMLPANVGRPTIKADSYELFLKQNQGLKEADCTILSLIFSKNYDPRFSLKNVFSRPHAGVGSTWSNAINFISFGSRRAIAFYHPAYFDWSILGNWSFDKRKYAFDDFKTKFGFGELQRDSLVEGSKAGLDSTTLAGSGHGTVAYAFNKPKHPSILGTLGGFNKLVESGPRLPKRRRANELPKFDLIRGSRALGEKWVHGSSLGKIFNIKPLLESFFLSWTSPEVDENHYDIPKPAASWLALGIGRLRYKSDRFPQNWDNMRGLALAGFLPWFNDVSDFKEGNPKLARKVEVINRSPADAVINGFRGVFRAVSRLGGGAVRGTEFFPGGWDKGGFNLPSRWATHPKVRWVQEGFFGTLPFWGLGGYEGRLRYGNGGFLLLNKLSKVGSRLEHNFNFLSTVYNYPLNRFSGISFKPKNILRWAYKKRGLVDSSTFSIYYNSSAAKGLGSAYYSLFTANAGGGLTQLYLLGGFHYDFSSWVKRWNTHQSSTSLALELVEPTIQFFAFFNLRWSLYFKSSQLSESLKEFILKSDSISSTTLNRNMLLFFFSGQRSPFSKLWVYDYGIDVLLYYKGATSLLTNERTFELKCRSLLKTIDGDYGSVLKFHYKHRALYRVVGATLNRALIRLAGLDIDKILDSLVGVGLQSYIYFTPERYGGLFRSYRSPKSLELSLDRRKIVSTFKDFGGLGNFFSRLSSFNLRTGVYGGLEGSNFDYFITKHYYNLKFERFLLHLGSFRSPRVFYVTGSRSAFNTGYNDQRLVNFLHSVDGQFTAKQVGVSGNSGQFWLRYFFYGNIMNNTFYNKLFYLVFGCNFCALHKPWVSSRRSRRSFFFMANPKILHKIGSLQLLLAQRFGRLNLLEFTLDHNGNFTFYYDGDDLDFEFWAPLLRYKKRVPYVNWTGTLESSAGCSLTPYYQFHYLLHPGKVLSTGSYISIKGKKSVLSGQISGPEVAPSVYRRRGSGQLHTSSWGKLLHVGGAIKLLVPTVTGQVGFTGDKFINPVYEGLDLYDGKIAKRLFKGNTKVRARWMGWSARWLDPSLLKLGVSRWGSSSKIFGLTGSRAGELSFGLWSLGDLNYLNPWPNFGSFVYRVVNAGVPSPRGGTGLIGKLKDRGSLGSKKYFTEVSWEWRLRKAEIRGIVGPLMDFGLYHGYYGSFNKDYPLQSGIFTYDVSHSVPIDSWGGSEYLLPAPLAGWTRAQILGLYPNVVSPKSGGRTVADWSSGMGDATASSEVLVNSGMGRGILPVSEWVGGGRALDVGNMLVGSVTGRIGRQYFGDYGWDLDTFGSKDIGLLMLTNGSNSLVSVKDVAGSGSLVKTSVINLPLWYSGGDILGSLHNTTTTVESEVRLSGVQSLEPGSDGANFDGVSSVEGASGLSDVQSLELDSEGANFDEESFIEDARGWVWDHEFSTLLGAMPPLRWSAGGVIRPGAAKNFGGVSYNYELAMETLRGSWGLVRGNVGGQGIREQNLSGVAKRLVVSPVLGWTAKPSFEIPETYINARKAVGGTIMGVREPARRVLASLAQTPEVKYVEDSINTLSTYEINAGLDYFRRKLLKYVNHGHRLLSGQGALRILYGDRGSSQALGNFFLAKKFLACGQYFATGLHFIGLSRVTSGGNFDLERKTGNVLNFLDPAMRLCEGLMASYTYGTTANFAGTYVGPGYRVGGDPLGLYKVGWQLQLKLGFHVEQLARGLGPSQLFYNWLDSRDSWGPKMLARINAGKGWINSSFAHLPGKPSFSNIGYRNFFGSALFDVYHGVKSLHFGPRINFFKLRRLFVNGENHFIDLLYGGPFLTNISEDDVPLLGETFTFLRGDHGPSLVNGFLRLDMLSFTGSYSGSRANAGGWFTFINLSKRSDLLYKFPEDLFFGMHLYFKGPIVGENFFQNTYQLYLRNLVTNFGRNFGFYTGIDYVVPLFASDGVQYLRYLLESFPLKLPNIRRSLSSLYVPTFYYNLPVLVKRARSFYYELPSGFDYSSINGGSVTAEFGRYFSASLGNWRQGLYLDCNERLEKLFEYRGVRSLWMSVFRMLYWAGLLSVYRTFGFHYVFNVEKVEVQPLVLGLCDDARKRNIRQLVVSKNFLTFAPVITFFYGRFKVFAACPAVLKREPFCIYKSLCGRNFFSFVLGLVQWRQVCNYGIRVEACASLLRFKLYAAPCFSSLEIASKFRILGQAPKVGLRSPILTEMVNNPIKLFKITKGSRGGEGYAHMGDGQVSTSGLFKLESYRAPVPGIGEQRRIVPDLLGNGMKIGGQFLGLRGLDSNAVTNWWLASYPKQTNILGGVSLFGQEGSVGRSGKIFIFYKYYLESTMNRWRSLLLPLNTGRRSYSKFFHWFFFRQRLGTVTHGFALLREMIGTTSLVYRFEKILEATKLQSYSKLTTLTGVASSVGNFNNKIYLNFSPRVVRGFYTQTLHQFFVKFLFNLEALGVSIPTGETKFFGSPRENSHLDYGSRFLGRKSYIRFTPGPICRSLLDRQKIFPIDNKKGSVWSASKESRFVEVAGASKYRSYVDAFSMYGPNLALKWFNPRPYFASQQSSDVILWHKSKPLFWRIGALSAPESQRLEPVAMFGFEYFGSNLDTQFGFNYLDNFMLNSFINHFGSLPLQGVFLFYVKFLGGTLVNRALPLVALGNLDALLTGIQIGLLWVVKFKLLRDRFLKLFKFLVWRQSFLYDGDLKVDDFQGEACVGYSFYFHGSLIKLIPQWSLDWERSEQGSGARVVHGRSKKNFYGWFTPNSELWRRWLSAHPASGLIFATSSSLPSGLVTEGVSWTLNLYSWPNGMPNIFLGRWDSYKVFGSWFGLYSLKGRVRGVPLFRYFSAEGSGSVCKYILTGRESVSAPLVVLLESFLSWEELLSSFYSGFSSQAVAFQSKSWEHFLFWYSIYYKFTGEFGLFNFSY